MSQSPKIVAILAGGNARRFGGKDKGNVLITGKRLIDIIHERLKFQSTDIIISGLHDYGLGCEVIPDVSEAPEGPVGGIYSIWKNFQRRDVEGFFTAAVDGPNLPHNLTARLHSSVISTIAADDYGRHPTYGWWRLHDLSKIWEKIDTLKSISLNKMADLVGAEEMIWEGDRNFININRPDDLEKLIKDP